MLEPCEHLLPLLDYEVKKGNHIRDLYICGGSIDLTINLTNKMDIDFELNKMNLPLNVVLCLLIDPHYEYQIGFECIECHQVILGPLNIEELKYWMAKEKLINAKRAKKGL